MSHLSAVLADEWPLAGVDAVVDVEVALARVRLPAHAARPRLLPRVRPHVLLQRVVVVARLLVVAHRRGVNQGAWPKRGSQAA